MELNDVLTFIGADATEEDLERIHEVARDRRAVLGAQRAAAVRRDAQVQLYGLQPKYLNGLTGTVVDTGGSRASVRLDAESTAELRISGIRRFSISRDEETFVLEGVPKKCCVPA